MMFSSMFWNESTKKGEEDRWKGGSRLTSSSGRFSNYEVITNVRPIDWWLVAMAIRRFTYYYFLKSPSFFSFLSFFCYPVFISFPSHQFLSFLSFLFCFAFLFFCFILPLSLSCLPENSIVPWESRAQDVHVRQADRIDSARFIPEIEFMN